MNKSLQALASQRSVLESLKIQGRALLHRGNVSMEEADTFIEVADAVLAGEAPATISANLALDNPDADAKLELGVLEVDKQLASTNDAIQAIDQGQVPPADAVVTMDSDEAEELDTLIDEAEELDAAAEFGHAIQDEPGLDQEVALEQYKALVTDIFRRADVSLEDIAVIDEAEEIGVIVEKVEEVRDVADEVIKATADTAQGVVSTESFQTLFPGVAEELGRILDRAESRRIERESIDAVQPEVEGDGNVSA